MTEGGRIPPLCHQALADRVHLAAVTGNHPGAAAREQSQRSW